MDNESDVSWTRDDQVTGILPLRLESKLAVRLWRFVREFQSLGRLPVIRGKLETSRTMRDVMAPQAGGNWPVIPVSPLTFK